ncbi:MAG: DUF805 domain-containing protein [Thermoguttaceae bacterium]|nr:DUF805 domain-containing protein [Thermoguttaceae bacterium]
MGEPEQNETIDEFDYASGAFNPFELGSTSTFIGEVDPVEPEVPTFSRSWRLFWDNGYRLRGRASRTEFWFAVAQMALVTLAHMAIALVFYLGGDFSWLFLLALKLWFWTYFVYLAIAAIPALTLLVRRLRDANLTGWLALLGIAPFVWFAFFARKDYLAVMEEREMSDALWLARAQLELFAVGALALVAGLLPPSEGDNKYGLKPAPRERGF